MCVGVGPVVGCSVIYFIVQPARSLASGKILHFFPVFFPFISYRRLSVLFVYLYWFFGGSLLGFSFLRF